MKTQHIRHIFPVIIVSVFLAGCTSQIYYWGTYEDQLYAYLNGESRETQIQALEAELPKMEDGTPNMKPNGKKVPPGFYAQLGMLYSEIGDDYNAIACFEKEKALFPEAATYMDYLLRRYGK